MNVRKFCFLQLFLIALALSANAERAQNFNFGWKFHRGPCPEAETASFDDAGWECVDLPHDYQILSPWDKNAPSAQGFKATCEGWYRKTFEAKPEWRSGRVLLDFEGMLAWGDVYLNGEKVGGCDMGYLGFEIDIGDKLKYDAPNVVAVWTTTGPKTISRWYAGGGIYRDVHLITRPRHGFARHGLFVRTPVVSASAASVQVGVELEGFQGDTNAVTVAATVFDPQGRSVAQTSGRLRDFNQRHPEVMLVPCEVKNPELWSPDSPRLYSVEAEVRYRDASVERRRVRFGIREVTFSPDEGMKLNGRKLVFAGVANHHDLGVLGAAAFRRSIRRYVETLKRFGFNGIRTSHNPYSTSLLELCDELGMMVVDEWTDAWTPNGDRMCSRTSFNALFPQSIPEWIRRDRNHPSVVMWSLGNELQRFANTSGFETDDWGCTTYRMLDVLVKRYDPTRKTTVAQYPAARDVLIWNDPRNRAENDPEPSALLVATEIASQNYFPDRYAGYKRRYPHLILFQSEAATESLLKAATVMDLKSSVGFAYWGAVEYWGESNGWPKKGWNYSWFAHDLEPYPQAWLIRSFLKDDVPVAKIGVEVGPGVREMWNDQQVGQVQVRSTWNFRSGTTVPKVYVYTNGDAAELLVNGRSLGTHPVDKSAERTRNVAVWEKVPYGDGGRLEAVAKRAGREIARDIVETTGRAMALRLEPENAADWRADGMDLLYLRLRAVDAQGRAVPDATDEVSVDVTGAATMLALDDGDHYTATLPTDNPKRLHHGRLLAILRAARKAGEVAVTLRSPTLGTIRATYRTKPSDAALNL